MARTHRIAGFAAIVVFLAACHAAPGAKRPGGDGAAVGGGGPLAPDGKRASVAFAVEAPLSLTASDGTGLAITGLNARAVVDGSLAFTELTLAFSNPSERTLEGTFRITLPRGASLGRFAMKIDGEWQEGEVVELEAARRAYEDFLHRKQDPALMEKAAGNEFSARVFPIPARGVTEIVVSYVEEVKGADYTLPLRGLPELGNLDVDVKVAGTTQRQALVKQAYTPTADLVVALPNADSAGAVRSGDLAIIRVKPQADSKPDPLDNVMVLVDTSASRVLGFEDELRTVEELVKKVSGDVTVAAFDQKVTSIYSGPAKSFGGRELGALKSREALGASNLENALVFAKDNAKTSKARRVVLVTDGVATAGATDPKKLLPRVMALKDAGIERIDAVGVGGIRDESMLGRIVRGTLAHDGVVAEAGDMGRRLAERTRSGIAVKVEGATWSWPTKLDGVQAGDTYSVYATLAEKTPLRVSVDGAAAQRVEGRVTDRPLVERAVAQARIASLLEKEASPSDKNDKNKDRDATKREIVKIAVRDRILTPYTAMLVLETEQDYARFGIARTSLADVLAIQDGGVKRVHRDAIQVAHGAQEDAVATRQEESDDDGPVDLSRRAPATGAAAREAPKPEPSSPRRTTAPRPARPVPDAPPPPKAAPAKEIEALKAASSEEMDKPASRSTPSGGVASRPPSAPPPPPSARATRPGVRADSAGGDLEEPDEAPRSRNRRGRPRDVEASSDEDFETDDRRDDRAKVNPYEGRFKDVMERIAQKRMDEARKLVDTWRAESPGDVLALVALGEVAEAQGNLDLAARAYGSVIDLFSNRADLRRFAGERLERVGVKDVAALDLAIDSFEKALADRPDHPSSGRLLTYALVRRKSFARAFEVAVAAAGRGYEVDRFAGVDRILREDVGLVGAAWAKAEPGKRGDIMAKVRAAGGADESKPSLRFVLNWETDANDVDFHIHDANRGHAFYSSPRLRSGGELYADVTTGYGPECFTIRTAKKTRAAPYHLDAHYYSRGPMGYGMGKLEVIEHDGNGNLTFEESPFIVMVDGAFVDLGEVR